MPRGLRRRRSGRFARSKWPVRLGVVALVVSPVFFALHAGYEPLVNLFPLGFSRQWVTVRGGMSWAGTVAYILFFLGLCGVMYARKE